MKINTKYHLIVLNITNNVTINDCANIQIALNSSPIMTNSISEIEEICSKVDSVYINIGTINLSTFELISAACRYANKNNIPIILDPVGANFTKFRFDIVKKIMNYKISVIKCNFTELYALVNKTLINSGVDSDSNLNSLLVKEKIQIAKSLMNDKKFTNSTLLITGKEDLIVNKKSHSIVTNGNKKMTLICGTGCMLGAAVSAIIAKNNNIYDSCVYTSALFKLTSQKIKENSLLHFKTKFIDGISNYSFNDVQKFLNEKN